MVLFVWSLRFIREEKKREAEFSRLNFINCCLRMFEIFSIKTIFMAWWSPRHTNKQMQIFFYHSQKKEPFQHKIIKFILWFIIIKLNLWFNFQFNDAFGEGKKSDAVELKEIHENFHIHKNISLLFVIIMRMIIFVRI